MTTWVDFAHIKSVVNFEAVLSHYGLLDTLRQKKAELVGACPIHKGTNKSQFHVSTVKNVYNCFGDCRGGGNIIDFVCKMEDVEPRKAGLLLQEWFGIESQKPDGDKEKPKACLHRQDKPAERAKEKKDTPADTPKDMQNTPLKFSLNFLDGDHAYIKERGLNEETVGYFGIGFCKKGIMQDRIAIPIHNENGELVAYIGRWPGDPPEDESKYKLPNDFHKSLVVFHLDKTKELAKEKGLILVEGFFGCMKVWQAGYKNVVAIMGSSLSQEQEDLILEAVGPQGKVILMFDEDDAGIACCNDVLVRLLPHVYAKVVVLPEGKQPDNLNSNEIKELLEM